MSSSPSSLVAELQSLRRDLAELQARVLALESQGAAEGPQSFSSPVTVNYTLGAGSQQYPSLPPFLVGSPSDRPSVTEFSSPGSAITAGSYYYSEVQRREAAVRIGQFLRRSLAGEQRGESGRSALKLPSKCYVLCRDIHGQTYNPARLFQSWAALKPFVKINGSCGDSVFIGLPSEWEAEIAIREAGLQVPANGGGVGSGA